MRFDVITLFPELFAPHLTHGVTRRAFESGQVDVQLWPLRDFADAPHRRVDDRPYGGGPGMVMLAEPLERALAAVRADRGERRRRCVSFHADRPAHRPGAGARTRARAPARCCCAAATKASTSASSTAMSTSSSAWATSCCPAARLPALALLDAVARLQPGVLRRRAVAPSRTASARRPARLPALQPARVARRRRRTVPPVLLSGHHARDRALAARACARADGAHVGPT